MALLCNATRGRIIANRVDALYGFFERAVGLLARGSLGLREGAWIAPCNAIHTLGMRVAIDVIFVDAHGRVLRLVPNVQPNRLALRCPRARAVVELGSGALRHSDVRLGDYLALIEAPGDATRRERTTVSSPPSRW